jgi:hypothetical protein
MRKIIFLSFLLFTMTIMITPLGYGDWGIHDYTETERQAKYEEADLVFDGSFIDATAAKGDIVLNAVGKDPTTYKNQKEMVADLPFVIKLNVDKVNKGEIKEKVFTILIHSPSIQFGVDFENTKMSQGKKFRIYIINSPNGRILIGQEALTK